MKFSGFPYLFFILPITLVDSTSTLTKTKTLERSPDDPGDTSPTDHYVYKRYIPDIYCNTSGGSPLMRDVESAIRSLKDESSQKNVNIYQCNQLGRMPCTYVSDFGTAVIHLCGYFGWSAKLDAIADDAMKLVENCSQEIDGEIRVGGWVGYRNRGRKAQISHGPVRGSRSREC